MALFLLAITTAFAVDWQKPPQAVLDVLLAPEIPSASASPDGEWLLLLTPVRYPPLSDRAAPMRAVAGIRIDPRTNGFFGSTGSVSPALVSVDDGATHAVALPDGLRVLDVVWAAKGGRFALVTRADDHVGLWLGDVDGDLHEVPDLALSPLLGDAVAWMPDQDRLLVKRVAGGRGPAPTAPATPTGPIVRSSAGGASASSTYEARDLITSPTDEASFTYFATSQLAVVSKGDRIEAVGEPGVYGEVEVSPNGKFVLVERVRAPWSYRVAWWQFAHDVEVWDTSGRPVRTLAALSAAEQVPIHGVPLGPRDVAWRQNAPATLVWAEALDGGDPSAKVPHRDHLMTLAAPFEAVPVELLRVPHRVEGVAYGEKGLGIVFSHEWERRWDHVWTMDLDHGARTARPWFDQSENERYADPGSPVFRANANGTVTVRQDGDWVYFAGAGSTPDGDRPFLDRRSLRGMGTQRLFRSEPTVLERFVTFVGDDEDHFLLRRESPTVVPNVHLATFGARVASPPAGEASLARTDRPVTTFTDPTPQLRGITKRIVTTKRADGVPISFTLYLPAGYHEGTPLPTVLHAYPREFSDPGTAGQVTGSEQTFARMVGPTELFFLLDGYAVLQNTTMPVLGDPDTAYDTFVEQLVASASAAIDEAVRLGVTDRDRVGAIGHSHGGLMVATLLAHSDLFRAGIARSGAYNHTIRPFGFQNERRTLWEAKDTYLAMSPVLYAPDIHAPILLVHGAIDENPGTVPLQSERLFEAVRGSGGTARLVLLPFEGHGYQALESVEHVLWEQLQWFDTYVKHAPPRQ